MACRIEFENDVSSRVPTEEQRGAIETIKEWVFEGVSLIALSGPAGSGKSTIIEVLQREISHVIVSAMTNKAADVLRRKGIYEAKTTHQAGLATVFSEPGKTLLRYFRSDSPVVGTNEAILLEHFPAKKLEKAWQLVKDGEGNAAATAVLGIDDFFGTYFSEWKEQEEKEGILIIDEASMLGSRILTVLQKTYSQIILVGDEMQLQPINDEPLFWKVEHTVRLTEIHRQSANSESLVLANKLRAGEDIQIGPAIPMQIYLCKQLVPIIVWRNDTRKSLTLNIRRKLRYGKVLSPAM